MSREHLYKAKRANWRELPKDKWWVEGYFIEQNHPEYHAYIIKHINIEMDNRHIDILAHDIVEIDPETICEYTGLTDRKGMKIFENDFVSCRQYIGGNWVEYCIERGYVEMKHGAFGLHRKQGYYRPFKDWLEDYEYEVIGNIFDNSELLKGDEVE